MTKNDDSNNEDDDDDDDDDDNNDDIYIYISHFVKRQRDIYYITSAIWSPKSPNKIMLYKQYVKLKIFHSRKRHCQQNPRHLSDALNHWCLVTQKTWWLLSQLIDIHFYSTKLLQCGHIVNWAHRNKLETKFK